MTHSWESEFRRKVASHLIDEGNRVRSNVYLDDSGRFVDLVSESDTVVLAIETESNFESALKGVSQAAIYAEGIQREYAKPVFPLVIVPEGHTEEPERTQIEHQTGVTIRDHAF